MKRQRWKLGIAAMDISAFALTPYLSVLLLANITVFSNANEPCRISVMMFQTFQKQHEW